MNVALWTCVSICCLNLGHQDRTNLSGDWVLVGATTTASRASPDQKSDMTVRERPTAVTSASGAAFNCGRQCRIRHESGRLTVDEAVLGPDDRRAPPVTFVLDGREHSVIDTFNPDGTLTAQASVKGNGVEIASRKGTVEVNQVLTLKDGELAVVTAFGRGAGMTVAFRYRRR